MDSDYFFGMVGQFETKRVQAYRGPIDSSAFHKVPKPFGLLMHNIIEVFDKHIERFCCDSEKIVLIGFQPIAVKYHSDLPIKFNRIYSKKDPRSHFCCSLEFIVVPIEQKDGFTWQDTDSILIDFSSGHIMDQNNFFKLLSGRESVNHLGKIEEQLLNTAWQMFQVRNRSTRQF